jgi:small multidrug resistance pump
MPSPSPWLLLILAIGAEVIGTSCLRLSAGMSRPLPTLVVLSLPLGLTYALWSGIGIGLISVGVVIVNLGAPAGHR